MRSEILLQEIDGKALLLMTRNDVLTGMSFKLGPALKIYAHVERLQTRGISMFRWCFSTQRGVQWGNCNSSACNGFSCDLCMTLLESQPVVLNCRLLWGFWYIILFMCLHGLIIMAGTANVVSLLKHAWLEYFLPILIPLRSFSSAQFANVSVTFTEF